MRPSLTLATLLALLAGCGSDDPELPASRIVEATLELDANGISEPLPFDVPNDTRSVTVVAVGEASELFALASFDVGGLERVDLDTARYQGDDMGSAYFTEQAGQMPGGLFQTIRLGTFTHVFPHAPGQTPTPGPAQLRIASSIRSGTVDVRVLLPEENDASTLRINLIAASESAPDEVPSGVLDAWQAIFDQADIDIVVDQYVVVRGNELANITDFSEPQESPTSQSAQLALLGRDLVDSDSLSVFLVDSLPFGVAGLSLGVPGPPVSDSYYYGVVARYDQDTARLARVLAHEVGHFMALQHPSNRGVSGADYPDPIDDTEPGDGNLMDSGTTLTPGQAFALKRSALLTTD